MEIKHRVLVLNNNTQYDRLKKAFNALSIKYEVKQHGLGMSNIICFLSDNDPNYEKLKQTAKSKQQFDGCEKFWRNDRWLQLSITRNGMNSSYKIRNFWRNSKSWTPATR